MRVSANLVDWLAPPLAVFEEMDKGLEVRYPSPIGDGDNASVGSGRPWLFYTHEAPGGGWKGSTFMSRRLQITRAR